MRTGDYHLLKLLAFKARQRNRTAVSLGIPRIVQTGRDTGMSAPTPADYFLG
ncbi:hypothetical protein [Levilactobacillus brevis]|uniref:hypothetical protein n=1 Tax=Levilactobacillus brevis TaxID=1580 RepID=UPI00159BA19A|nr:hypothetical protein [Levilactobacillus brevis]